MTYDNNNIFAKIIRKEIPCNLVFENDHVLAFYDLYPKSPIHILVIPKGPYVNYAHFMQQASQQEIISFFKAIDQIATDKNCMPSGFRLITNCGPNANQEVQHFHMHLCAGGQLHTPFPINS